MDEKWIEERKTSRDERYHIKNKERDYRTHAQHDRDRLINTMALRRLAHVTQVVNPHEGRFFHNRLTHTLKVAMIAKRMAEFLLWGPDTHTDPTNHKFYQDHIWSSGGLDPDVVEAAALAHDFGHPPFGHIGEYTLNRCVICAGNEDGYEGNAQSFRIVTRLEIWREGTPGLDLTKATLHALLKYPYDRSRAKSAEQNPLSLETEGRSQENNSYDCEEDASYKLKYSYYQTEKEYFDFAEDLRLSRNREGLPWRWLEAAIMDWADDIAYATHDVEDFYLAGRIPLDRFVYESSFAASGKKRNSRHNNNIDLELDWFLNQVTQEDHPSYQQIRDVFVDTISKFPYQTRQGRQLLQRRIRHWAGGLVDGCVKNTRLNSQAHRDPNQEWLEIKGDWRAKIKVLKKLTKNYVHSNYQGITTQQYGEQRIVESLFDYYFSQACKKHDENSILTKEHYATIHELEEFGLIPKAARARVVADVISGMTDEEAVNMHHRLTGITLGSFADDISID